MSEKTLYGFRGGVIMKVYLDFQIWDYINKNERVKTIFIFEGADEVNINESINTNN